MSVERKAGAEKATGRPCWVARILLLAAVVVAAAAIAALVVG